ncbi:MAG: RimK family alpha-L-glutamate ligase [Armatimonadetes bacterium]|nr:RimK family alpha-L-glutamate ligase [Armatimonadota bacterium]
MRRIGIVTPDFERDWASRELLNAAMNVAEGLPIDPLSSVIEVDNSGSIRFDGEPAESFDAFILRYFSQQGEVDYQYDVFELIARSGKLIINSLESLSVAESKAQTTFFLKQAGLPVPRTIITQKIDKAMAAIEKFGTAVIKPLYGSHGIGVEKVVPETSMEILPTFLQQYRAVYVQEFIPNNERDIRAFVVGDEVVAAMYRYASEGQWKTNVYQGGKCEPCNLTDEMREMCLAAARILGLDYTGVDIIEGPNGPLILELNGAPSWFGLSDTTSCDIASEIIQYVLWKLDRSQPARMPMVFTMKRQP